MIGRIIKTALLAVLGLFALGVISASLLRRPDPPSTNRYPGGPIVHETPLPIRQAAPPAPIAQAPPQDVRFGLTEDRRAEICRCRWQGGMWATAEVERLYPMDNAPQGDPPAWERFMKERDGFYKGREAIAEQLVANKYGLPAETIRAIDDEWGELPMERRVNGIWKMSKTPVLFDQGEANRTVEEMNRPAAKPAPKPKADEIPEERTRRERQQMIDKRKAKRAGRRP